MSYIYDEENAKICQAAQKKTEAGAVGRGLCAPFFAFPVRQASQSKFRKNVGIFSEILL